MIIHDNNTLYIPVALVHKPQDFQDLSGFKPIHSHLWYNALPIKLPSPWEQAGVKEEYTSASSWCPLH